MRDERCRRARQERVRTEARQHCAGPRQASLGACPTQRHVRADLRFGTFLPFLRASERPIAMACLRLLTVLPLRPLLSAPFLRFFIARSTYLEAPLEYLRAILLLLNKQQFRPLST